MERDVAIDLHAIAWTMSRRCPLRDEAWSRRVVCMCCRSVIDGRWPFSTRSIPLPPFPPPGLCSCRHPQDARQNVGDDHLSLTAYWPDPRHAGAGGAHPRGPQARAKRRAARADARGVLGGDARRGAVRLRHSSSRLEQGPPGRPVLHTAPGPPAVVRPDVRVQRDGREPELPCAHRVGGRPPGRYSVWVVPWTPWVGVARSRSSCRPASICTCRPASWSRARSPGSARNDPTRSAASISSSRCRSDDLARHGTSRVRSGGGAYRSVESRGDLGLVLRLAGSVNRDDLFIGVQLGFGGVHE